MRVLVQRVSEARVEVDGSVVGAIGPGLLAFVCAMDNEESDPELWAERLCHLRCFSDRDGRMNNSLVDTGGSILLVSQFTLSAALDKGRRPSFGRASEPQRAAAQIDALAQACRKHLDKVETGSFGATMQVHLINDGPVTLWIDKP